MGQDKEHGLQFQGEHHENGEPTTVDGIERYLGNGLVKSGLFKQVGRFGAEVLTVIDSGCGL